MRRTDPEPHSPASRHPDGAGPAGGEPAGGDPAGRTPAGRDPVGHGPVRFGPVLPEDGLPVLPELAAVLAAAASRAEAEPVGGGPVLLDAACGHGDRRG
ncbi:hypothetical protein ACFJEF_32970, partial [Streptomyces sp. Sce081]